MGVGSCGGCNTMLIYLLVCAIFISQFVFFLWSSYLSFLSRDAFVVVGYVDFEVMAELVGFRDRETHVLLFSSDHRYQLFIFTINL